MPKENLPHDGRYLVCCEDEVKKEPSKLSSELVTAYQRGWVIVKPSFIEWAVKEKKPPSVADHAVDLTPLQPYQVVLVVQPSILWSSYGLGNLIFCVYLLNVKLIFMTRSYVMKW